MRLHLVLSALLLSSSAHAEDATSDKLRDDEAPKVEAGPLKTKLAVMSLSVAGVPEAYGEGLTETIATTAEKTGVFETVSPRQIKSLLAYEKKKELMGGCVDAPCYAQVAQLVRAQHLVAGSVAKVGPKLILNLTLVDAAQGKALNRTNRETSNAAELMDEARRAIIVLLQPVLQDRRGYLKVASNVPDAGLSVDDERRAEQAGQVIELAAGPHVLKVVRDGFYTTTTDVFISPGRVTVEEIKLIPAKETIESYESSAEWMRWGGYGTAVLAVGGAVLAGVFYGQATDDKNYVDSYANALAIDRVAIPRDEVLSREDSFTTNQTLYLTFLGTAVVAGGVSLYLFLSGDDPDRYEEFHTMSGL